MPVTYKLIQSVTVGAGGAANITFSSIPSTYTDLVIKLSTRGSRTDQAFDILTFNFNGDSSTVYSYRNVTGLNAAAGSLNGSGGGSILAAAYNDTNLATASTFGNGEIYIPNYTSANFKSISADSVSETNAANGAIVALGAGLFSKTTAISSITFAQGSGNIVQHSTATLYGIKNS
jgi:hypothetical protein